MNLPGRQRGGIFVRVFFLVLVPLVGGAAGLYWYALGGRYVVTDNAYVKADMIAISASIDGRVSQVMVEDNQPVKQGEALFVLDARSHRDRAHTRRSPYGSGAQRTRLEARGVRAGRGRDRGRSGEGEVPEDRAVAPRGSRSRGSGQRDGDRYLEVRKQRGGAGVAATAREGEAGSRRARRRTWSNRSSSIPAFSKPERYGRRRSSRSSTPRYARPPTALRAGCSSSPASGCREAVRSSASSTPASSG